MLLLMGPMFYSYRVPYTYSCMNALNSCITRKRDRVSRSYYYYNYYTLGFINFERVTSEKPHTRRRVAIMGFHFWHTLYEYLPFEQYSVRHAGWPRRIFNNNFQSSQRPMRTGGSERREESEIPPATAATENAGFATRDTYDTLNCMRTAVCQQRR